MKEVKVILTAPIHLIGDAQRAFDYAYHNSTFSGGWACIQRGPHTFYIKRNKGGYSARWSGTDADA